MYCLRLTSLLIRLPLLAAIAPLGGLQAQSTYATPYTFTTFAGASRGSTDATDSAARILSPMGVAVDGAGNLYVADASNSTIRKITTTGVVTTIAGTAGLAGSTDGTGSAARFRGPTGLAVDGSGNIYVADTSNSTIRKISAAGVVTTLAGAAGSNGSDDGTGSAARFSYPSGVAVDGSGNVYVADSSNHTIRKITSAGVVTTFAGTAGLAGSTDGTGSAARFFAPKGVAVDGASNVYVADFSTIRKITSAGVVTTLAGNANTLGASDGTGSAAEFYGPRSVAVDGAGNVYVADSGNFTIRKVTADGVVTTLAGTAGLVGSADGTGSAARFYSPRSVAVDRVGNIYVADTPNSTIRKITAAGEVTTLPGTTAGIGSADGAGSAARFRGPTGLAADGAGNIYVADTSNHTIRKITAAGAVTTIAGTVGLAGATDGTGSAARFSRPIGVAVDGAGNVYVADTNNSTIRKISADGVVTTLAGTAGSDGPDDGTGSAARFSRPMGVAVDGAGNVYVADNNTIRKITADGMVTTLAGTAGLVGSADGTGGAARFNAPWGVAVDGSANIYVAEINSYTIRKITSDGVVTTLAGTAGLAGSTDGTGSAVRFMGPSSVAVDGAGNLYVVDMNSLTIRKITADGVVTTLAGTAGRVGSADGTGSAARFNYPWGVAVDGSGNVYVADTGNNTICKGVPLVPGDFNSDGRSDIIWTNTTTGERALWLMNRGKLASGASLGSVPTAWKISGTGDFNGDGKADVVLSNTTTGDRAMWLMNGPTIVSGLFLGNLSVDWTISAVGDFNADGKADFFLSNTVTGDRAMWLMNGGTLIDGAYLGVVPVEWKVSGTGDFNGHGNSDLIWTNTTTGERAMWLMNGGTIASGASLGVVPTAWTISGTGDFNGDGKADVVLSNTATGDRAMWLMNGPTIVSGLFLGNLSVDWTISSVGDFNGDGKADLFWSNTVTGERAMWLMNGGTLIEGDYLGNVPVEWVNPP